MRISDSIEQFIKEMLGEDSPEVELKRNELAEYFGCAPSQINYVLATRFSPSQGYLTESRRGGGGYIRIVRVVETGPQKLAYLVRDRIGDSLSEEGAARIIAHLRESRMATDEEAALMASALSVKALAVPVSPEMKGTLRARIMKSMILALANKRNG
ncbi:MAG: CtsR family transcriptional regulator [Clostridiales bacterium]|nr:CtsR family transcriptional regulator [Clostridiales bacterium]